MRATWPLSFREQFPFPERALLQDLHLREEPRGTIVLYHPTFPEIEARIPHKMLENPKSDCWPWLREQLNAAFVRHSYLQKIQAG